MKHSVSPDSPQKSRSPTRSASYSRNDTSNHKPSSQQESSSSLEEQTEIPMNIGSKVSETTSIKVYLNWCSIQSKFFFIFINDFSDLF